MPQDQENDRRNDMRLLTPLLVMALIIACGFLLQVYLGSGPTASG